MGILSPLCALLFTTVVLECHGSIHKVRSLLDPISHRIQTSLANGELTLEDIDAVVQDQVAPMVHVDGLGTAKGVALRTYFGRQISAFRGIPYAKKPPRFEYARLYNDLPWPGTEDGSVYDASYFRSKCPQHSLVLNVISGNEDCLHINIYTPFHDLTSIGQPLPVMVFIHGGAYITGEATYFIPTRLMDKDVVVATINYRLGTLGFLYSGTPDAPGNMGLMDQITALRWVKQYISYFGGNKDLVTVFGQSAGGASTSWMQITPLTGAAHNNGSNLARAFIPMSGTAFEYWTLNNEWQSSFIKHVNATGCPVGNVTDPADVKMMMDCMKNEKTISEIVYASLNVTSQDIYDGNLRFIGQVPVIQKELIDNNPDGLELVIVEDPVESVQNDRYLQVPLMLGSTRDEGSLVIGIFYNGYILKRGLQNDAEFLRDDILRLAAEAFGIYDNTNSIANSFRLGYMPNDVQMGTWEAIVGPMVDIGGAAFLKSGPWALCHEVTLRNSSAPVYFYSYEFESVNTFFDWMFFGDKDLPVPGGVSHADDLIYLFNLPSYIAGDDEEMVKRMTTIYSNFAIYGHPTPDAVRGESGQWGEFAEKWIPYTPDEKSFMLIQNNWTVQHDFVLRWNYNKYGYPSQNTSDTGAASGDDVNAAVVSTSDDIVTSTSPVVAYTVLGVSATAVLISLLYLTIRKK